MKTFLLFVLFILIAIVVILLAVILGNDGAWYFAWLIGTGMIVLVTVAGGVMLDTQLANRSEHTSTGTDDKAGAGRA